MDKPDVRGSFMTVSLPETAQVTSSLEKSVPTCVHRPLGLFLESLWCKLITLFFTVDPYPLQPVYGPLVLNFSCCWWEV